MISPLQDYPLERRPEEFRRLRIQAEALAPEAAALLDRIGVKPGWRCLDLGCGVGGIVDLLAERVGATGRVVGLDLDAGSLAAARRWAEERGLGGVEFVEADAADTKLPRASFDLVHIRYLFTTVGWRDALLREALALVCPGGVLAVQEGDATALACYPPHADWERLKAALIEAFARAGADTYAGRRLFQAMRRAGLDDVQFRPCLVGATSSDPLVDYLPETISSVRRLIVGHGLMSEDELDAALERCGRHLADPDTVTTSVVVVQVWGRKPAS